MHGGALVLKKKSDISHLKYDSSCKHQIRHLGMPFGVVKTKRHEAISEASKMESYLMFWQMADRNVCSQRSRPDGFAFDIRS